MSRKPDTATVIAIAIPIFTVLMILFVFN